MRIGFVPVVQQRDRVAVIHRRASLQLDRLAEEWTSGEWRARAIADGTHARDRRAVRHEEKTDREEKQDRQNANADGAPFQNLARLPTHCAPLMQGGRRDAMLSA